MILEYYCDQDREQLLRDCIEAYKYLYKRYHCGCGKCRRDLIFDFEKWNPLEDYNDTFKMIGLMECFGCATYSYDTVLYSFEFTLGYSIDNGLSFSGEGIFFQQAVANCFVQIYKTLTGESVEQT
jgi:hypothetical protein